MRRADGFQPVKDTGNPRGRLQVDRSELTRMADAVSALERPSVHGNLAVRTSLLGVEITSRGLPFWAKITGLHDDGLGTTCYSFSELWDDGAGNFAVLDNGRKGFATVPINQAYEVTKSATVPTDGTAIVIMWLSYNAITYEFWWPGGTATTFTAPVTFEDDVTFNGPLLTFNYLNQFWNFLQRVTFHGAPLTFNNEDFTFNGPVYNYGGIDAQGGLLVTPLGGSGGGPQITIITQGGTGGSTPYTYGMTGTTPGGLETGIPNTVTTTTGNGTLTGSNTNIVTFTQPGGNIFTGYNLYRLSGPTGITTGRILTIPNDPTTVTLTGIDTGQGAGVPPPGFNQTGTLGGGSLTTTGITVQQVPPPPPPSLTVVGTPGTHTVTVRVTLTTGGLETGQGGSTTITNAPDLPGPSNYVRVGINLPTGIPVWLRPVLQARVYTVPTTNTPYTTGPQAIVTPGIGGTFPDALLQGQVVLPGPTSPPATGNIGTVTAPMYNGINVVPLQTPTGVTVQPIGATGATTDDYAVVAYDGTGGTVASTPTAITNANATLDGTNYNRVAWNPVPGALYYGIRRETAGGTPSSTGEIGTVYAGNPLTLSDTGLTGDASSPPASNTTGRVLIAGSPTGSVTSVATGTGLTGGPITAAGTIALADTAVTPATYGDSTHVGAFTVDQQGRLTAASSVAISSGMAIGDPVVGATANYVLFSAAGPVLAEDSRFQFYNGGLTVGDASYSAAIGDPGGTGPAGAFADSARTVVLCDGTAAATIKGPLHLAGSSSGFVGFVVPAAAGSTTYTLPAADGSAGDSLQTDASGNLSWGPAVSTTGTNGQVAVTPSFGLSGSYASITGATFTAPATGTYLIQAQVVTTDASSPASDINCKLRNTTAGADLGQPGETKVDVSMTIVSLTMPLLAIAALTSGDVVYVQGKTDNGGTVLSVLLAYVRLA